MGKKSKPKVTTTMAAPTVRASQALALPQNYEQERVLLKRFYRVRQNSTARMNSLVPTDITDIFLHELSLQSNNVLNLPEEEAKKSLESRLFQLAELAAEYKFLLATIEALKQKDKNQAAVVLPTSASAQLNRKMAEKLTHQQKMNALADEEKLNEFISRREIIGKLLIANIYYLINKPEKTALIKRLICGDSRSKMYFLIRSFAEYFILVENSIGFQVNKSFKIFKIFLEIFSDSKYYGYDTAEMDALHAFIEKYGSINYNDYTLSDLRESLNYPIAERQLNDLRNFCGFTNIDNKTDNNSMPEQFGMKIRPYLLMGLVTVETARRISQLLYQIVEKLLPHFRHNEDYLVVLFNLLIFSENIEVDCFLHENIQSELDMDGLSHKLRIGEIFKKFNGLEKKFIEASSNIATMSFFKQLHGGKAIREYMLSHDNDFPLDLFTEYLVGGAFCAIPDLTTHLQYSEMSLQSFVNKQILVPTMPISEKQSFMKNLGLLQLKVNHFFSQEKNLGRILENLHKLLQEIHRLFSSIVGREEGQLQVSGIVYLRLLELLYNCEMITCYVAKLLSEQLGLIIRQLIGNDKISVVELKNFTATFFTQILPELEALFNIIILPLPELVKVEEFRCLTLDHSSLTARQEKKVAAEKAVFSHEQVLFYRRIFSCRKGISHSSLSTVVASKNSDLVAAEYLLALHPVAKVSALCHQLEMLHLYQQKHSISHIEAIPDSNDDKKLTATKIAQESGGLAASGKKNKEPKSGSGLKIEPSSRTPKTKTEALPVESNNKKETPPGGLETLIPGNTIRIPDQQTKPGKKARRRQAQKNQMSASAVLSPPPIVPEIRAGLSSQGSQIKNESPSITQMEQGSGSSSKPIVEKTATQRVACLETGLPAQVPGTKSEAVAVESNHKKDTPAIGLKTSAAASTITIPEQQIQPGRNARRRQKKNQMPSTSFALSQSFFHRKVPLQSLGSFVQKPTKDEVPGGLSNAEQKPVLAAEMIPIPVPDFQLKGNPAKLYERLKTEFQLTYPDSALFIFGTGVFELISAFRSGLGPPRLCNLNFGLCVSEEQLPIDKSTYNAASQIYRRVNLGKIGAQLERELGIRFEVIYFSRSLSPTSIILSLNSDFAHCGFYIQDDKAFAIDALSFAILDTKELVPMYPPQEFIVKHPRSLLRATHFLGNPPNIEPPSISPHSFHWPCNYEAVIKQSIQVYLPSPAFGSEEDWFFIFRILQADLCLIGLPYLQRLLSYGILGVLYANNPELGIGLTLTEEDAIDASLLKLYLGDKAGSFVFFLLHSWGQFKRLYHNDLIPYDAPLFLGKALEGVKKMPEVTPDEVDFISQLIDANSHFWIFRKKSVFLNEQEQQKLLATHNLRVETDTTPSLVPRK